MKGEEKSREPLICALCLSEPVLVKYFDDELGWIWLGISCAAAKGNSTALMLKANQWINGLLEPVINVEAVQ